MRRAALLALAVALPAGCGHDRPAAPAAVAVERVDLRPGSMALVVANGTDRAATLAQVAVDDGFVPYRGGALVVAPHTTSRLTIPYPGIAGQAYRIKVLTGEGEALEYRVDA